MLFPSLIIRQAKILIFYFLICCPILKSSAQQIDFTQYYSCVDFCYANDMILTSDSGFLLTGNAWRFHGDNNGFLLKTDRNGNQLWIRQDSLPSNEEGLFVKETSNGNYLFGSWVLGSPSYTYVMLYDSSGLFLWDKTYYIPGGSLQLNSMIEINKEFYYFGSHSTDSTTSGVFIKTDFDGNIISTIISNTFVPGHLPFSVLPYGNNNIILTGSVFDSTQSLYFPQIIVIDTNCNIVWQRTYSSNYQSTGQQICSTLDGGYLFSASAFSGPNMLYKIDSLGNLIWSHFINANSSSFTINYIDTGTILVASNNIQLLWLDGTGQQVSRENIFLEHPGGYIANTVIVKGKIVIGGGLHWGQSPAQAESYLVQLSDSNLSTSIAKLENKNANFIYPTFLNSSDKLHLHIEQGLVTKINIYSIDGKIEKRNIRFFSAGLNDYFINLIDLSTKGFHFIEVIQDSHPAFFKFYLN